MQGRIRDFLKGGGGANSPGGGANIYLPEEHEGTFGSLHKLVHGTQLPLVLRVEILRRVDDKEQRGVEDVDRPAVQVPRLHHQLLVSCREKALPLGLVSSKDKCEQRKVSLLGSVFN